jgi:hypothetical protein
MGFERDAELKRQTQIGMARLERDYIRVDRRLLDADFTEEFGKSATGFATQAGQRSRRAIRSASRPRGQSD